MVTKLPSRQDTKLALMQAGMDIMLEKGYTNTGIQEVLSSLGVPKGSFYHYFESKENFAVAIIRQQDSEYNLAIDSLLNDSSITPLQRLKKYCQDSKNGLVSQECRKGCLIGNLSQEMSDQSEVLRKELSIVMKNRSRQFARCIEEGQKTGEITQICPADKLADFFLCGWNGAVMLAKTMKDITPMETFIELVFDHFLKARA